MQYQIVKTGGNGPKIGAKCLQKEGE